MKLNTKIEADFYNLQTCKIPLQLNNFNELSSYILQHNKYKINKSRC